ncbi:MAG: ABC transporter substrate-binding protein [Actinomycetota bacterium]
MENGSGRHRRRALVAGALLVAAAGGCGTQLTHEQIVAYHEGHRAEVTSRAAPAALPAAPGVESAPSPADAAAAAPAYGAETPAGGGNTAAPAGSVVPPTTAAGRATGSRAPTATGRPSTGAAAGTGPAAPVGGKPGAKAPANPATPAPTQPGAPAPARGAEVVLGNIGSYSGVLGSIFKGGRETLQAWAQTVNGRGGLAGHPVRFTFADDAGDPARALSIARDMVERQRAIAIVGGLMPTSLPGIRKYLEEKSVPLIGGDNTLSDWYESPVIFPEGTTVNYVGKAGFSLLQKAGESKQAVFFCGESPSCAALTHQAPAGVELVYKAQISLAQVDFTGECLRAKEAGATGLYVAADANTVLRVARSCAQQNYKPRYTTASVAVGPQLATDPNLDGLVAPVNNFPWFLTDASPATVEYGQAMATYARGVELSSVTAGQWASGKLVERAASAFDADPAPVELLGALGAIRNETLGGLAPTLNFNPGKAADQVPCYFVVAIQGGKWAAPNGMTPAC